MQDKWGFVHEGPEIKAPVSGVCVECSRCCRKYVVEPLVPFFERHYPDSSVLMVQLDFWDNDTNETLDSDAGEDNNNVNIMNLGSFNDFSDGDAEYEEEGGLDLNMGDTEINTDSTGDSDGGDDLTHDDEDGFEDVDDIDDSDSDSDFNEDDDAL
ncbi:Fut8p [Aspergillus tanneri]|uniref:Fut8p n=1 Tax=Aspergillus tanneri TaxID=1220188 RepID=A0A5M9MSW0_9EURO|nr:Fut8p [Aspergillus tanneri]KAA8645617.1 Fut8p [Aspergillus tanneri]